MLLSDRPESQISLRCDVNCTINSSITVCVSALKDAGDKI